VSAACSSGTSPRSSRPSGSPLALGPCPAIPRLYFHHGIYVSDDRVIQFGSGVTLRSKGGVGINEVTLEDFEQGGTATVVRHGYESWFTGHHPAADEPWKIVERAEFLLKRQPALKYNLIGHNCEIIANMCASGSWTES
jgi:hypothetical protein